MCCGAPESAAAALRRPRCIWWALVLRTTRGERWLHCCGGAGVATCGRFPARPCSPNSKNSIGPGREYLWISFSRSGESPEGVALLERALDRHREIRHLVITCNEQGAMAQLCSRHPDRALALVLDDAVNDRGLAMTSSFSNMVLAGQCVANAEDLGQFGELVSHMTETGTQFLPAAAEVAGTVTTLGCTRACFVGSGALRGSGRRICPEGRGTKRRESDDHGRDAAGAASRAHVERRRPDVVRGLPVERCATAWATNSICCGRSIASGWGGCGPWSRHGAIEDVSALADYCLSLDCVADFPDHYRPVLDVMLGQLVGLFASMRCGLKPDQPSPGGTITRVVSPIKLY